MIYKDNIPENISENKFEDDEEVFVELHRMAPSPGNFNNNFQPPKFLGHNFPGNNHGNNFPECHSHNCGNNHNCGHNHNNGGNSHNGNNFLNNFNPLQLGAPPNYIPQKNAKGIQNFNSSGQGGHPTTFVSQNSIQFCLFQFTYIWEVSGRAYWAFLLNVNRSSVSGLRWFGGNWVYFGVDLRRIDSFICYRNNDENCCSCHNLYRSSNEIAFENKKKLYTNTEVRESVGKTLVSLDIPEVKDDFIIQSIGVVDGETIESSTPCVKYRNTQYTINLEVSYPESLDKNIKDKVLQYAHEASKETSTIMNSTRGSDDHVNPLESFNDCTKVISKALETFSSEFNSKLRDPEIGKDISRDITYSITQGKSTDSWKTKI